MPVCCIALDTESSILTRHDFAGKEDEGEAVLNPQVETLVFGVSQAQAQKPAEAPVFARRKNKGFKAGKGGAKQAAASAPKQAAIAAPPVDLCTEAARKQYEAVCKAAQEADQIAFKAKQQAFLAQEEAKKLAPSVAARPKVRIARKKAQAAA